MKNTPPLPYETDQVGKAILVRRRLSQAEWGMVLQAVADMQFTTLLAAEIPDSVMAQLPQLTQLTRISSGDITDEGLRHLAQMPQLEELDLSNWRSAVTDEGLKVLRHLPELRKFSMAWAQRISDEGVSRLAHCHKLERVHLLGTRTGDGLIRALTEKNNLTHLSTGMEVTDEGLLHLHRYPVFKQWQGGKLHYQLMSNDADPNHLQIAGPYTNKGLASLAGLDGLFGLSFFGDQSRFTAAGLAYLAQLPHLGFLGCDGERCDSAAMHAISTIPQLRMLMAQGTIATDEGFAALSRSKTIEYLWGRECHNLTGHGFRALASMPSLKGLAVSCKFVDGDALATLPQFPALRELMPMDLTDDGFQHIGRCEQLQALWCMYCRDTTDRATEHIAGLQHLHTYYAGKTQITDESLRILGNMHAFEVLRFWNVSGITDAGVPSLQGLPRLREVEFDGCTNVTREGAEIFPAQVRVKYASP